jgi:hypothetical protein
VWNLPVGEKSKWPLVSNNEPQRLRLRDVRNEQELNTKKKTRKEGNLFRTWQKQIKEQMFRLQSDAGKFFPHPSF